MQRNSLFLFMLILFAISFAKVLADTGSPALMLTIQNNNILAITYGGKALTYSTDGSLLSKKYVSIWPFYVYKGPGDVYVLGSNGQFRSLNTYLNITYSFPAFAEIFGLGVTKDKLFLSSSNGLIECDISYYTTATCSYTGKPMEKQARIGAGPVIFSTTDKTLIIYALDDTLYVATSSGQNIYSKKFKDKIYKLYINTGRVYIFTDEEVIIYDPEVNKVLAKMNTVGKPTAIFSLKDKVYVGTTSGYIHIADDNGQGDEVSFRLSDSGIAYLSDGFVGGVYSIIAVSNDGIYAIDKISNQLMWVKHLNDNVVSALYYKNHIYLSTVSGKIYSIDTTNVCSIFFPEDGSTLNYKNIIMLGRTLPSSGTQVVLQHSNYNTVTPDENGLWKYVLDPSSLSKGWNSISCGNPDEGGSEINVFYPDNFRMGKFIVEYPSHVDIGKPIEVDVKDAYTDKPIDYMYVTLNGKTINVNSSKFTYTFRKPGKYKLTISHEGYDSTSLYVNVGGGMGFLGIFGILILIIAVVVGGYMAYARYMMKKMQV